MMIRSLIYRFLFVAVAVMGVNAHAQIPEGWEIVTITDDPNVFDNNPDINDRGQIVFSRQLDLSDIASTEIFFYDRGNLIRLTNDAVSDAIPRINNRGEIVWRRNIHGNDQPASLVIWHDGELKVFSDQPFGESSPDINDAGQVVWKGLPDPKTDHFQIFFFDGESVRQITNDMFSNQGPRINEVGQFVWTRFDFSVFPWTSEIILYDNGLTRQISNGQGQITGPDLNERTQVVWGGDDTGIDLWQKGQTNRMVETNAINPRINNRGCISMSRWDSMNVGWALWVLRDGNLLQVADGSLGGPVSAMNERGEIVFVTGRVPSTGIALLTNRSFVGDFDLDGDVDLLDFSIHQTCFGDTTPFASPGCLMADVDADGVVGANDYRSLQKLFNGPQ